jgi:hypothetical protein
MTREIFCELAEWKNLTPLTNAIDEWQDVREYCADSEEMYQNLRNPSCFSKDGGKTYYSLDDPEFGKDLDEVEDVPWQDRVEWHTSVVMEEGDRRDPIEPVDNIGSFSVEHEEKFNRWYITDGHDHYIGTRGNVSGLRVYYKSEAGAERVLVRVKKAGSKNEGQSDFKDLEVNRKAEHKADKKAKKDKD